jgi:UDPglucose 6-dehydrogenase
MGRRITLLGLAFKPGTDDLRDAQALELVERLCALGAEVHAHDPVVGRLPEQHTAIIHLDHYEGAEHADAVVLVTEWADYAALDFEKLGGRMSGRLLLDGRNMLRPEVVEESGLVYVGIGRPRASRTVERGPGELW